MSNFTCKIFFFICERFNFIIRCDCGKCKCSPQKQGQVWGRLCECDDFSCLRGSGKYNSFTNNSCTYQCINVSSPFSITWIYYCIKGDIGADEMCSGRGDCSCKECKCYPDWSGEDCSCSLKVDNCLSPYTNSYCSRESKFTTPRGKEALTTGGQCECNKCVCSKVSSIW